MYRLNDKKSAVREVQKFLNYIYDDGKINIPRVSIDGIFTEETARAVEAFQREMALLPTGKVDRETFELLYFEYSEIVSEQNRKKYVITELGFPLREGDQSNDVLNLNLMLIELAGWFSDIGQINRSTYYSKETRDAVKALQKIFRVEEDGEVDSKLYERISLELDSVRRLGEEYT